jgi:CRISPR-associated endonuclease/helicase Cas3
MKYLAHISETDCREQSILAHLQGTADLSEKFSAAFGAGQEGRLCGMLHDIGKYSDAFQQRLHGSQKQVDHSTAGAYEAWKLRNIPASFCVAGHHAGLPDFGSRGDDGQKATLSAKFTRAEKGKIEDYSAFFSEVTIPNAAVPKAFVQTLPDACFFTRMLYSCLVDADYLDTENFMQNGDAGRGDFPPLGSYETALAAHISPWLSKPQGTLGEARSEILRAALAAGSEKPGLFTFTAPTGSGKTISSMAFALAHARENKLRRIIYVIPYCSIIEQTQGVFESVFGEGSVVAHYADVDYQKGESSPERDKRYLAAENWDAPVILTTTVQFFESLYGNRPSRCRKLHNLADSVLIFDEAQMLPVPFLRPCVAAVSELVRHYGCTAVLCTATQPALDRLFREQDNLPNLEPIELCPRREELYEQFRRVRYEFAGTLPDDALAACLGEQRQVLCVVNRRDQAQALFALLPKEGRFHLSTAMCPADRKAALREIRERLSEGKLCRVVSTSLIEAGVDVDFPVVYRALAGLDSILQSGGRCNREGQPGVINGTVYIFESDRPAPRMLAQNIAAAKYILGKFPDIASPAAVSAYFQELFYLEKGMDALDEHGILRLCASGGFPFASIAERFRIIPTAQNTVYIPKPESEPLLQELERFGPSRRLLRKLGLYAVGVYPQHFEQLRSLGALHSLSDSAAVLTDTSLYSRDTGLALTPEEGRGLFA